jgi:hypothetical protein
VKLYHFTAARFLKGIDAEGLTLGRIAKSIFPAEFIDNAQWLTSNPSWEQQCLIGTGLLPYSRTEARLHVVIPKRQRSRLFRWHNIRGSTPLYDTLSSQGDPENWYVFMGRVKPGWIRRVDIQNGQSS